MLSETSEQLRMAIENLINAKLHDLFSKPDGLSRLVAHRATWVASPDICKAEKQLEEVLAQVLPADERPKRSQRRVALSNRG